VSKDCLMYLATVASPAGLWILVLKHPDWRFGHFQVFKCFLTVIIFVFNCFWLLPSLSLAIPIFGFWPSPLGVHTLDFNDFWPSRFCGCVWSSTSWFRPSWFLTFLDIIIFVFGTFWLSPNVAVAILVFGLRHLGRLCLWPSASWLLAVAIFVFGNFWTLPTWFVDSLWSHLVFSHCHLVISEPEGTPESKNRTTTER